MIINNHKSRAENRRCRFGFFGSSLLAAMAMGPVYLSNVAFAAGTAPAPGIRWGINESGLEFGKGLLAGTNYAVPDASYFLARDVALVRLPFQIVRLQPAPGAPLAPEFVANLKKIIQQNQAGGAITVLDPHGYGAYPIDGKPQNILVDPAAADAYVDMMGKIGAGFANDDVAIGLMNEPHQGSDEAYLPLWNRAIAAIRNAGFHGVVLVPHAHWSTAADITPDTPFTGGIVDPDNNWVLELHSYLDPDNTGTYHQPVASASVGADRLAGAIAWSRQSHVKLFLGETGTPPDAASVTALSNMFDEIAGAPDVFWGVALWGGGPWWKPNYPLRLEPTSGVDTPQFRVLENMITPLMFYFARDPGGADPEIAIRIDGTTVTSVKVTTLRSANPQMVPIKSKLSSGVHVVEVVPVGPMESDVYVVDSTWKGAPNSKGSFGAITGRGYKFDINVPG